MIDLLSHHKLGFMQMRDHVDPPKTHGEIRWLSGYGLVFSRKNTFWTGCSPGSPERRSNITVQIPCDYCGVVHIMKAYETACGGVHQDLRVCRGCLDYFMSYIKLLGVAYHTITRRYQKDTYFVMHGRYVLDTLPQ